MALIQQDLSVYHARICIWSFNILYWFLFAPITAYHTYQFWDLKRRRILFFEKRHPNLVLTSIALFTGYPLLFRCIGDFIVVYQLLPRFHPLSVLLTNVFQAYPIVICLRLWLLYYDYNFALQSLNFMWKTQITHQDKLPPLLSMKWIGNLKILSAIALSLTLFSYLVLVMGMSLFGESALSYSQSLSVFFFLLICALAFKIRKSRDEFGIKQEFVMVAKVMMLAICIDGVVMVLFPFDSYSRMISENLITCCTAYAMCLIMTYWTIRKYQIRQIERYNEIGSVSPSRRRKLSLDQILSDKDGFDLFANHLVNEFSIEHLFFLLEMTQIKYDAVKNGLLGEDDAGEMMEIAESRIDHTRREDGHVHNEEELTKNLKYIFKNYIDPYSQYAVNVSGMTRVACTNNYITLQTMEAAAKSGADNTGTRTPPRPTTPTSDHVEPVTANVYTEIDEVEMQPAYQKAQSMSVISLSSNSRFTGSTSYMRTIKDKVVMYDAAMHEVMGLLRMDSLPRFEASEEYQTLCRQVTKTKN